MVYDDTVLGDFGGTGTASLAALLSGRDSVGYELEAAFTDVYAERMRKTPALSADVVRKRLADHRAFVARRRESGTEPGYESTNHGFPVTTKQGRTLQLYTVEDIESTDGGYRVTRGAVVGGPDSTDSGQIRTDRDG